MDIQQMLQKHLKMVVCLIIALICIIWGYINMMTFVPIHSQTNTTVHQPRTKRVMPKKHHLSLRLKLLIRYINQNYDNNLVKKVSYNPNNNHINILTTKRHLSPNQEQYVKRIYQNVKKGL